MRLTRAGRGLVTDGTRWARRGFALARAEFALLAVLFVIAGGAWIFVALADEVHEGETEAFDRAVILAFRNPADSTDPIGPLWLEEAMRDLTALGGNVVLSLFTLLVIGFLLLARRPRAALLVVISVIGGTLLSFGLKLGFDRPRPDLVPHGADVYTASFPSAHATLSATVYLTLGSLLTRLQLAYRLRFYFLFASLLLTIIVGVSRIYLGVHWPTDVLAGWALGAAWAMLVWFVALVLQRRGKIGTGDAAAGPPDAPGDRTMPR